MQNIYKLIQKEYLSLQNNIATLQLNKIQKQIYLKLIKYIYKENIITKFLTVIRELQ